MVVGAVLVLHAELQKASPVQRPIGAAVADGGAGRAKVLRRTERMINFLMVTPRGYPVRSRINILS